MPRGEPVRAEWRDDFVSKIAGSREQLDQVPVALLD
jgi:hypothetical protein